MTDCISREAALDFRIPTFDLNISAQDERAIGDRFEEFLESIPAADVVEVVRCKECSYWDREWQPAWDTRRTHHYCPMIDGSTTEDFFCSFGARRADNG